MLTIFYDGHCPLCAAEMQTLQSLDTQKKLQLEDIHADSFSERFPYIDKVEVIDYCTANSPMEKSSKD